MTEVKVGLLVVVATGLFLALSVSIGNFQQFFTSTVEIRITLPSSGGLEKNAPITYSGVRVGAIRNIYFDMDRDSAVIVASINYNSPVCLDSEAIVTSTGLLAPLYIELRGGSKDQLLTHLLDAGEIDPDEIYIAATPYATIGEFFALAGDVKSALAKVETVLDNLNEPLIQISGLIANVSQDVGAIFIKLDGIVTDIHPHAVGLMEDARGMIASASNEVIPALRNVREGSEDVPLLLADAREKANSILGRADGMIASASPEVVGMIQDLRGTVDALTERFYGMEMQLSGILASVDEVLDGNKQDIRLIVSHIQRAASQLDDLSQQLARDPWRAVWRSDGRREPVRVSPQWEPLGETP